MEDTWKSLTDPVLLVVFSYLDVRELNIASRTCKIWRYGHDTALMHSKQIVDNPSYVNYVEFNKAETHLLVHCVCREDEFFNTVAILSIEKGAIQIVAARSSEIPQFRGTWLSNNTFLNADTTDSSSPDDWKLTACKLMDEVLDENDPSLGLRIQNFLSKKNLDVKILLHMEGMAFYANFVKVIDWSEWNYDVANGQQTNTTTNEMVTALYLQSKNLEKHNRIVFYKINLDSPDPVAPQPIKTIVINSECLGIQLSEDHRCLVYNLRRLSADEYNIWHEKEVVTMVINLKKMEEKPETFDDNKPLENSFNLSYFFPSVSTDLVANESDPDIVHLWDRHSHQIVSRLSHRLPNAPTQNGVSAVAFHPRDQEVLVSVADDRKLRIWMSTNRQRHC
ncbi:uncharacterized protein LOC125663689 isoform X2 [Ostrea edulis]|uniref:uncharacterized protein LOC125663689 isoform X2 n=1 Tax=Ostrea edulis TaxID=37623 RepID=UPI0024AF25E0|nr:uncharacterized protein LOC125663689 isoform X2 [Ostrea edulis]